MQGIKVRAENLYHQTGPKSHGVQACKLHIRTAGPSGTTPFLATVRTNRNLDSNYLHKQASSTKHDNRSQDVTTTSKTIALPRSPLVRCRIAALFSRSCGFVPPSAVSVITAIGEYQW